MSLCLPLAAGGIRSLSSSSESDELEDDESSVSVSTVARGAHGAASPLGGEGADFSGVLGISWKMFGISPEGPSELDFKMSMLRQIFAVRERSLVEVSISRDNDGLG